MDLAGDGYLLGGHGALQAFTRWARGLPEVLLPFLPPLLSVSVFFLSLPLSSTFFFAAATTPSLLNFSSYLVIYKSLKLFMAPHFKPFKSSPISHFHFSFFCGYSIYNNNTYIHINKLEEMRKETTIIKLFA